MAVTNDITAQHIHTSRSDQAAEADNSKKNLENAVYNDMVQCYQLNAYDKNMNKCDIQHIGAYNSRVTHIEGLDIEVSVLPITR